VPDTGTPVWDGTIDEDFEEFTAIAQLATDPMVMVTNPDSSYESVEDLGEAIKEKPKDVKIGIGAEISSEEGEQWYEVAQEYGVDFDDMTVAEYDGGSEIENAILGNEIDTTVINLSSIYEHIDSGDLTPLAVLSSERVEYIPDVPTLQEEGVDHIYERIRGFWANKDMPDEAVEYWEDTFEE